MLDALIFVGPHFFLASSTCCNPTIEWSSASFFLKSAHCHVRSTARSIQPPCCRTTPAIVLNAGACISAPRIHMSKFQRGKPLLATASHFSLPLGERRRDACGFRTCRPSATVMRLLHGVSSRHMLLQTPLSLHICRITISRGCRDVKLGYTWPVGSSGR